MKQNPIHHPGSPKGRIICTASNAGLYPFPVAPLYAATKHAVVGLVRSLGRPLQQQEIQINALAPAVIRT
jgi:NAD(P)-dependent dehydrogenase (short-subunit alcohol dehydrogenase family)